jgi:hypothetical protein
MTTKTIDRHTDDDTSTLRPSDLPRKRKCLMCKEDFQSEWSGERICQKCKKTAAWRSGVDFPTRAA